MANRYSETNINIPKRVIAGRGVFHKWPKTVISGELWWLKHGIQ